MRKSRVQLLAENSQLREELRQAKKLLASEVQKSMVSKEAYDFNAEAERVAFCSRCRYFSSARLSDAVEERSGVLYLEGWEVEGE